MVKSGDPALVWGQIVSSNLPTYYPWNAYNSSVFVIKLKKYDFHIMIGSLHGLKMKPINRVVHTLLFSDF